MGRLGALVIITSLFFSLVYPQTDEAENPQPFIVRVQNDLKPSVFADVEQWYKSTLRSLDAKSDYGDSKSQDFIHVYTTVFHGFSAILTPQQAQQLAKRPGVVAVLADRLHQLQITRSPHFLGLYPQKPDGLLSISDSGSDVVIGLLDSGIWPEHRSFHDEDMGPIPSNWKGECVEGPNFTRSHCNRKIIGARYFVRGYEALGRRNASQEVKSPRDYNGHGTHTASTAAGAAAKNASLFGYASGVAVGVAPKARIAVYKVCWRRGCAESDLLSAYDAAVEDGVHVISASVGGGIGGKDYHLDPKAIAAFGAMERGILVSASAGNFGPAKTTVTNIAPWMTVVGASTIDRRFPADLVLGNGRVITGASVYSGRPLPARTFLPLIDARNASYTASCFEGTLNEDAVRGKIVLCAGSSGGVAKGEVVKNAGGVGVVVANEEGEGEGINARAHVIPGLSVSESAGRVIRDYINTTPYPSATISFRGTEVGVKPAPVLAVFSSRGPSLYSPYVLKPDVIAPGVDILAAWPANVAPSKLISDPRRTEFNVESGTSMSCPHVSGVAALLKGAHPDWSPAMIRSAMMTTAYSRDSGGNALLDAKSYNQSTIWDVGAGHVDPEKAVDPGLAYDITVEDYLNFLCASNYTSTQIRTISRRPINCRENRTNPWDLNYPAILVEFRTSRDKDFEIVATRTVTYVGERQDNYNVEVKNPIGATLTVYPKTMNFKVKGEKKNYIIKIKAENMTVTPDGVTEVGKITWSDQQQQQQRQVVSPVVVTWKF